MVLPWDKDFLSSKTELSSKTILYASEGQNVNNVSRSIVKKILGNIDSKDYLNLPLEEIASQNFIFLYPQHSSDIPVKIVLKILLHKFYLPTFYQLSPSRFFLYF